MINSVASALSIDYASGSQKQAKQVKQKKSTMSSNSDRFVSNDTKKNIENAKKNGSLKYTEPTKFLGLTLRDGYYTYYPQKVETIGQIKQKFGIPDKVISSMNFIYDDDYCPFFDNMPVNFKLEK